MRVGFLKLIFIFFFIFSVAWKLNSRVELNSDGFYLDRNFFYPVGVNYMPRDSAVYMWKWFSEQKIQKEFQIIREMGLNTIRTFIFIEDINPAPGKIDEENLLQIQKLLDLAEQENLKVILTLFTGHMSGENWYPKWMRGGSAGSEAIYQYEPYRFPQLHPPRKTRDIYEDKLTLENFLLQARVLAQRFRDHPALLYWDLGNEPQYWQKPRTPALGQNYVKIMVDELKKYDQEHPVSLGMGKFAENTGFHSYGEFGINKVQDLYLVHTYPAGYYPMSLALVDRYTTYYPGFELSLSRASGQPLQFQEFGLSKWYLPFMGSKERAMRIAGYYRNALWSALLQGAVAGTLSWCFSDYKLALYFYEPYISHPYELFFGAVNRKYELNPSGEELKRFAQIINEILKSSFKPHFDPVAILLPENYQEFPEEYENKKDKKFLDSHTNHNRFLFSAYFVLRQLGINPIFTKLEDNLSQIKLVIFPSFSNLTPLAEKLLKSLLEEGKLVYLSGNNIPSALSGFKNFIGSSDLLEVENALKPDEEKLERLRRNYRTLLELAKIKPLVYSKEPFVETGILNDNLFIAINHLPEKIKTEIEFENEAEFLKCFYGKNPVQLNPKLVELKLAEFGVEVCRIELLP